jgi:predicted unusual protein kinase regulating ubiquinone biosynthesis (AarF/ABC1/UbiB family)
MRRDILSDDYIAALQSLQDHIPPFPTNDAILEIERGLGRPVNELFPDSTTSRWRRPRLRKSTRPNSTMGVG